MFCLATSPGSFVIWFDLFFLVCLVWSGWPLGTNLLESHTDVGAGGILNQIALKLSTGRNILSPAGLAQVTSDVVEQNLTAAAIGGEARSTSPAVVIKINCASVNILVGYLHTLNGAVLSIGCTSGTLSGATQNCIVVNEDAGAGGGVAVVGHGRIHPVNIVQAAVGVSIHQRKSGVSAVSVGHAATLAEDVVHAGGVLHALVGAIPYEVHKSGGAQKNCGALALKVRDSGGHHSAGDGLLVIGAECGCGYGIKLGLNVAHTVIGHRLGNLEDTKAKTNEDSQSNQNDTEFGNATYFVFHKVTSLLNYSIFKASYIASP